MATTLPLLNKPTRTHCPFCAFQCGTVVSMSSGASPSGSTPSGSTPSGSTPSGSTPSAESAVALQISGDDAFPVNLGRLCIKGWTAGEMLNHSERLRTPLVRGADGTLRQASWAAALDELADRLIHIRADFGAAANGVFGSGALTNEKAYLLGKFARVALGTPNIDYNGRWCMSSAAAAANRAFGVDRGMPFPVEDIAGAEVVFLVGGNPMDTLPPMSQWFERQKAVGGRLIVADPRLTPTARVADLHLTVRPGGDLALANGMLYVAWDEGLLDRPYIDARTTGFGEALRVALQYEPARVEQLTGISESLLRRATRMLARGGPTGSAMLLTGRGTEQHAKGSDTVAAWINLMLALGKIGKPHSGWGCLTGQGNGQGGREHGQKADQLPGYRLIENPDHRRAVAAVWGVEPDSLPRKGKSATELLAALGPVGGVRSLLVMGSDVATAAPDCDAVRAGLARLDLLAVVDVFHNDTTRHAHIVLPTLHWAEEDGTMTNLEGRVIRRRRAVAPPPGVLSDLEILTELATRLGCGDKFAFAGPREVFNELRRASAGGPADYAGITYEKIDAADGVFWPCPNESHPGTPRLFVERFAHADGRARFHPAHHRPAAEEPDNDYPIRFTTGRYREHYNSGTQTRRIGPLSGAKPSPRLQMHPQLAEQLGLAEDAAVVVESRRGSAEFVTAITADIRPDTVFAPFHWGGAQAANRLTNAALDPVSRMPEYKVCAVRLRVPTPSRILVLTPVPSGDVRLSGGNGSLP